MTINSSSTGGIAQGITDTENGGTLTLNPGTYNKINQDTNININKSITIQGNGPNGQIIIDAQGKNRIFDIRNHSIIFVNITFINGNSSGSGGVIYNSNYENLSFINCKFINNTASSYGGAIYNNGNNLVIMNCSFTNNNAAHAGAIYASRSNFTLINTNFTNNRANSNGYGGAIYDDGISNFTVIDSNFNNNTAKWGGAIFSWLRNGVKIINSTFTDNIASIGGSGGAIYNEGDNYFIINSTFNNNVAASGYGGAIINHGGNFTLKNSNFTNNTAYASGGAIYNHNGTSNGNGSYNFTIMDSNFINNTAQWGGAIYNLGNNSTITNSNFTNNTAERYGGAINNNGNLTLIGSNFINNKARTGGAIYNNLNRNMSILNNFMMNNSAELGQMIYNGGFMGVLNLTYLNNSTQYVKSGQNVLLYATLTDDMGNTVTGQNISFYINGVWIGSLTSTEGYANITYLVNGVLGDILTLNGTYSGNMGYPIIIRNGELRIQLFTNSTIIAPDGKVGNPLTITGIATDENGESIANTKITITIDSKSYNVTTGLDGEWTINITPSTDGNFLVTVSWIGNFTHVGFTNNTSFNVNKIPTNSTITTHDGKVGIPIIISGVATDEDGNLIANTQINVINGKTYNVITNSYGEWKLIFTPNFSSNFKVNVSWAGNSTHIAFTNITSFNVNKIPTFISVIAPNSTVDKTINIHGVLIDEYNKSIANAMIIVFINGEKYTLTTDKNGQWTLPYKTTKTGKIKVSVNYEGNNIYLTSENATTLNVKDNKTINGTNKTTINPTANAALMKKTGMPIIALLILLISIIGLNVRKKQ
ncbi:hypothetical protein KQY27_04090 [Methanobrevibacter sp. TMH8]|uniref:beta strand repeat-containing protein n=1 Tax=Methanobrevibacter sp. TMH8 TaxID=2848611 RepID=UPI001CCF2727|nr:carboxypeptidase-like regulatory domain-containing protein [Methanobrevibacter sp. TMH8]MBZ9570726.1 hypothetical protein [Methanobrevibacter sp. TMH8]